MKTAFLKSFVIGVVMFFVYSPLLFAQIITPERVADIAVDDAKTINPHDVPLRIFAGETTRFPGVIRVQLLSRKREDEFPGKPYAVYEFDAENGKVIRRDFLNSSLVPNSVVNSVDVRADQNSSSQIQIHGVMRNLPGYILNVSDFISRFQVWAEAGGRVVATETELMGTTAYTLKGVPVAAGTIVIKAKIRGYDLLTLHPGVIINASQPVGTIAGIDVDFHNLNPILRNVRLVIRSKFDPDKPSFPNGNRARVYAKETGQSVEVVSSNGLAEAVLSDIPTGWPLNFLAVNLDQGYFSGQLGPVTIPENGGTVYTDTILMQ